MKKLDLKKQYPAYYTAKNKPELVDLEACQFLSIVGQGDPSAPAFARKVQALYATAYTLKFKYKALDQDFVVAKLEVLWSFDEQQYAHVAMVDAPLQIPRSEWSYRMMIRMPDYIVQEEVQAAITTVFNKKQLSLALEVELFTLKEGKVVQMMHIGPFATEVETLAIMQEWIQKEGLQRNGLHHEIYLSDLNKTAPDRLKTILREPVK